MSEPTPEPVLDERGRIDAATSVEAIIAKGWMRFPHDPPHPDSFALADAAITAYQSVTAAALTEALRERDEALLDAQRLSGIARAKAFNLDGMTDALTEAEHRADLAERRNQLNPQSTEYVQKLERQVAFLKASLAEYDRLFVDTTAGPEGTE